MWDVVVTVTLMAFGVFMVVAVGMIFIAAIYFLQNGDKDD
jgi:heme/copper-type cytochrome/quinol oxidase subunit 2